MPRNGDFKKLVRARMAKTGESYTIARLHMGVVNGKGSGRPVALLNPSKDGAIGIPDDLAICQVKISILDIEPEIWRRVLAPAATTLGRLHEIIQAAFGWWNYHLHQFVVDGQHVGVPDPELADEMTPMTDERDVTLRDILGAARIVYEYDFGDDWKHSVVIESVAAATDTHGRYPSCIGGARACPHEDCGGTSGYRDLLEILANPEHEEHRAMRTWAGRKYAPERFDLAATNRGLRKLQPRSRAVRRRADVRA